MRDEAILAVDIGGGTQDILLYEPKKTIENCCKLVLPSPTQITARQIREVTAAKRPLHLSGWLMGGGACVKAVKEHLAAGLAVYAEADAAKTINDDLQTVRELGVILDASVPPGAVTVRLGDVCADQLRTALAQFGVEVPQQWAVAVQDHGESVGFSNRLARFNYWREFIAGGGALHNLVYREIPAPFTRMRSVQNQLPGTILMDTGPVAVLGALEDPRVAGHAAEGVLIVNIGNQHTFGVLLQGDRVMGLFEHHTGMLNSAETAGYVSSLRAGTLSQNQVFKSGGHGCIIHPDYRPFPEHAPTVVVGPRRGKAAGLGWYQAAPFGDMMLTGCFGLLRALRKYSE